MDTYGTKRLLAAIIEQAVLDRRLAVTRELITEDASPVGRGLPSRDAEVIVSLNYFFYGGGLELISTEAGFDLPIEEIKRRSCERFEGRC